MKTLYFDCLSGLSGDMTIASLLDLGASAKALKTELRKLGLSKEYHLHIERSQRQQVAGVRFDVRRTSQHSSHAHEEAAPHSHDHPHGHTRRHSSHPSPKHAHARGRNFVEIRRLIERSKLSSFVRNRAVSLFHRIAIAEGKVHGVPTEKVHFHEVGAMDSIVDIVGVCILLEELAPRQILASTPCEGHGFVDCAHGRFPVPTMATLELLKGIPLRQIDVEGELITPTGAGILVEFVEHFGIMPAMTVQKIGYGLGSRSYPHHPNVLRALWGEATAVQRKDSESAVDVLETNLDDISPEILAAAMERLLAEGARDVFLVPVQMKKGRPATLLTVLSEPEDTERLALRLLHETGSFGVRIRRSERLCLAREIRKIQTRWGPIEIKIGSHGGQIISAKPEFESCRKLAERRKKPVRTLWAAALGECSKILSP